MFKLQHHEWSTQTEHCALLWAQHLVLHTWSWSAFPKPLSNCFALFVSLWSCLTVALPLAFHLELILLLGTSVWSKQNPIIPSLTPSMVCPFYPPCHKWNPFLSLFSTTFTLCPAPKLQKPEASLLISRNIMCFNSDSGSENPLDAC